MLRRVDDRPVVLRRRSPGGGGAPGTTRWWFRTASATRSDSDSVYPFNPDGTREFLEDKPFLDPFALHTALGAVTRRLRFVTFVLKLPVRHPVLVAKQATSVAVLTGGRLVLGVGSSPWREDYEVLGVPWDGRGAGGWTRRIEIIRGLAPGGYFEYHGDGLRLRAGQDRPGAGPSRSRS